MESHSEPGATMSITAKPSAANTAAVLSIKDIVTPVTVVTFVVSTVTGVMLLLHWNGGLVHFSHEWLSVVFSAIALWHLARNWRSFLGYTRRHAALAVFALTFLGCVAFTFATGSTSGARVSPGAVFHALGAARLEQAAPAFGMTTDAAIKGLGQLGVTAELGVTLDEIGRRSGLGAAGVATALATIARE